MQRFQTAEGLRDALVAKLTEQRNFVLWWDEEEKDPGGRPEKPVSDETTGFSND